MQRVERTARIAAPPADVFAYVADLDNLPEWQAGITSARRTSDGPLGVGATADIRRELMGQAMEATLTVTEHDPPHRLAVGSEVSGVKASAAFDFAPADGSKATDLTFSMEIRGSMLTSFMEPMIASAAAGDIEASLARLEPNGTLVTEGLADCAQRACTRLSAVGGGVGVTRREVCVRPVRSLVRRSAVARSSRQAAWISFVTRRSVGDLPMRLGADRRRVTSLPARMAPTTCSIAACPCA